MPIINYPAAMNGAPPQKHKYRDELQLFRRYTIARFYCALTSEIRASGYKSFGYFGGPFQSHDAIYASGAIEFASHCFDGIAIDHNFFNGYMIDKDPNYIRTIVNYAANSGVQEIVVGLYAERMVLAGESTSEIAKVFQDALDRVDPNPRIVGIEVGGLEIEDKAKARAVISAQLKNRAKALGKSVIPARFKVAVLGSFPSFELWQGDNAFNRPLHQDAIKSAVDLIESDPELDAVVIDETDLLNQLFKYDALYLPLVTAPSTQSISLIKNAISLGFPVVQDFKFAEFSPDGSVVNAGEKIFGIGAIDWRKSDVKVVFEGKQILIKKPDRSFATVQAMTSTADDFKVLAPTITQPKVGILLQGKNTLVLGFIPSVVQNSELNRTALKAIKSLIAQQK